MTPAMASFPDGRGGEFVGLQRVRVDRQSDIRVGVAEALRDYDYSDRDPLAGQFAGVAVAKAVQPHTGNADLLHHFRDAYASAVRAVVAAVRNAEDQIIVLIVYAEEGPRCVLFSSVFRQRRKSMRRVRFSRRGGDPQRTRGPGSRAKIRKSQRL